MPRLETSKIEKGQGIGQILQWVAIIGAAACASVSAQTMILSSNTPNLQITDVAMSADGATIAGCGMTIGATTGVVCVSTNIGRSWNSFSVPISAGMNVAVSPDGSLIALAHPAINGVLLSTNSGVTWVTNRASSLFKPAVVMFSGDGTHLFAWYGDYLNLSTNRGLTWQPLSRNVPFGSDWMGQQLISFGSGGTLLLSTNGGISWFQKYPYSDSHYNSATISADGMKLSAVEDNYGILVSTNSGSNWTRSSIATWEWTDASAADGARLVSCPASVSEGTPYGVYTSTNYGLTWGQDLALTNGGPAIAISQDGTRICGALGTGGLFIALWPPSLKFQPVGANVVLSWTAPSKGWALQRAVDLSANIWTNVSMASTVSNWEQQVIVTNDTTARFFRLTFTLP